MELMHWKESELTLEPPFFEYQSRIDTLEAEIKKLKFQHAKQLNLTKTLDVINKHIAKATSPNGLLTSVLKEFLNIFSCDRAWILSPCDPEAKFYRIHVEQSRANWPGAVTKDKNAKFHIDSQTSSIMQLALKASGAVCFDPQNNPHLIDHQLNIQFNVRSFMVIKIKPKKAETWLIGISHCGKSFVYSQANIELFEALSEKISAGLANLLNLSSAQTLFESTDVSILNTDLSEIYYALTILRENGVKNLSKHIRSDTQFIWDMIDQINFIDINQSALQLFAANSKNELKKALTESFEITLIDFFVEVFGAIFEKKKVFKKEVYFHSFDGRILNTLITFKIPEAEEDFFYVPINIIEISHIKHAELKLEVSSQRYHFLYESSPYSYLSLDENGKFIEVNPALCLMLGYKREELVGCWFGDFLTPDYFDKFLIDYPAFKETGMLGCSTFDLRPKNNHVITVQIDGRNAYNQDGKFIQSYCILQDISERIQVKKQLKKSNKCIKLLLDSTAEAIYATDIDGNCTLVNNACLNMLGYSDESELLGKNLCRQVHQCTALNETHCEESPRAFYQPISRGIGIHLEHVRLWRKDGSSFPVTCWSNPIIEDNEVVGVVVTFLDISDRLKDKATIEASHINIQSTIEATISAISRAIEARDPYTAGHQKSVADLSQAIALEMGLSGDQVKGIYLGASIHDIGKIQVPAEMLCKPSRLTALEYQLIQTHSQAGYEIIKDVEFPWPIANILLQHHERMDGSGYPLGLKGEQICLEARIVAVADVVEAMHSHRPYRPGLGIDKALDEIQVNRGNFYDKNVVDACLRVFRLNKFKF